MWRLLPAALARAQESLLQVRALTFTLVAIAGVVVWGWAQPSGHILNFDFAQAWGPDRAVIFGGPGYGQLWSAYPLPIILLFLPFGALSAAAAMVVAAMLTAALLIAALLLVEGGPIDVQAALAKANRLLPALISLPVLASIQDTHAFSALGLLALVGAVSARERARLFLFGLSAAVAFVRPINALPVVLCCLVGLRPRDLARAAVGGASVGLPLVVIAFLIDKEWPSQYVAALNEYSSAGLYRMLNYLGGAPALITILLAIGGATGIASARGRQLADMAYLGMAATVLLTPTNGLYTAVFALPALTRIGMRKGTEWFPWAASGSAWMSTLAAAPWLLGSAGPVALSLLSAIAYWFVLNSYPLLWPTARTTGAPKLA